jgi:hypothetical protein
MKKCLESFQRLTLRVFELEKKSVARVSQDYVSFLPKCESVQVSYTC